MLTHAKTLPCDPVCFSGLQYYMALSGIVGKWREQARLKLLLTDRVRHAAFCMRFSYRIAGLQTGALRVMTESGKAHSVLWEQRHGRDEGWHTEHVDVAWSDRAPESVRDNSDSSDVSSFHSSLIADLKFS